MASSRSAVLGMYRSFVRAGRSMNDYNMREYAVRRARLGFEQHRSLAEGSVEQGAALSRAKLQLAQLQRQVVIGNMYPQERSVIEPAMGVR